MADLKLPEQVLKGLKQLVDLDESQAQQIMSVVKEAPLAINHDDFARSIAKSLGWDKAQGVYNIIRTVLALYSASDTGNITQTDFVNKVCESDIGIDKEKRPQLKARLLQLWDLDSIVVTAKANDVMTAHEHTFHDARILTDIRPIFKREQSEEQKSKSWAATVIVHTLQITCSEGTNTKQIFIALDNADVIHLSRLLSEAEQKAKDLKSILSTTEIPYLEVNNE